MINQTQKEAICNTLGKQYSIKIIAHLKTKKIKPIKTKVFNPKIIQDIVNGRREFLTVEMEIVQLVATIKEQNKIDQKTIKKLLK